MEVDNSVPLTLGLLLAAGLTLSTLVSRLGVPRVLAYLLAGVLLSPSVAGDALGLEIGAWAEDLTAVALGIVAYIIGGAITREQLRRVGRIIGFAVVSQSVGAMVAVFLAVWALGGYLDYGADPIQLAIVLAAIATTTAPAATLAVMHQYRASGTLSSTLLGVVALDDALGIALFVFALMLTAGLPWGDAIGFGALDIFGSVLLGAAAGRLLSQLSRRLHEVSLRLPVIVMAILVVTGAAQTFHMSPLLAAMALGFFSRLFVKAQGDRLFAPVERFEELVFLIFFTVAGTHFDPTVFASNLGLIVVYFCARIFGKVAGATVGAELARAPPQVTRWLGPALMPQAGVAVGLALAVAHEPAFAESGELIVNVLLGSAVLNEILGPLAVRFSLKHAGELGERRSRST
jgi:Kef-type K+ transport system membrane component KefB